MTYHLDARVTTLGQLLRPPRVFDVPAFQRAYSWTTDEAGQLLEDLLLAIGETDAGQSEGGYFLGPVLLLRSGPDRDPGAIMDDGPTVRGLQIIDGQQRLATLTVLACVLRDLARENDPGALSFLDAFIRCQSDVGEPDRFRLQMRGGAQATMATWIQTSGSTLIDVAAERTRDGLSDAEAMLLDVRDHFIELLGDRDPDSLARIASFVAHDCEIAVITSGDVDRAHRTFAVLNNRGRPLDRSDIINAQLMDSVSSGPELDRLRDEWEHLAVQLGSNFDMLFSHIRSAIGDPRVPVIADIHRLADEAGGGQAFIDTILIPFGRAFARIAAPDHEGTPWSREINRSLHHLSWLGSGEWVAPTLLWWMRYADDPEQLARVLRRIERLAYGMRILGLGADKRQTRMQQVRAWIEKENAIAHDAGPLDFSNEELRNIRYNLRDLHRRSQSTCKLVLLRLDSELSSGAQRYRDADLTVEHILPQNPGRNSRWRDWFADAEERKTCTASLGNLVLLPRALNAAARNQDYERKLAVFFPTHGPPLPHLTEELRGVTTWTAPQIRAREERLLSILEQLWQLGKPVDEPSNGGAPDARRRRVRKEPLDK